MVSDFKKKVDAFLKKNNYKSNLISSKITTSSKELLQQIKYEEALQKSLCSNKYTVQTEKKSMKTIEICILGNNKVVTKQVISSELLQQRLLKQKETFLKDDRFNYDLKMTTMMEQYAEIVNRIQENTFTIKIPDNYIIQMSDYNEYYQIKEDSMNNFLENNLQIIADQIIHEIQQSKITTPKILSNSTSQLVEQNVSYPIYQIEHKINTEPSNVNESEILKTESDHQEQIIPDKKTTNKKNKQKQKNQQNQSEQSRLPETFDSAVIITDNDNIRRRNKEIPKIEQQEDLELLQQKELELEKERKQLIIKKLREFNSKFKPSKYLRKQSENAILLIEDPTLLAESKEKILKKSSLRLLDNIATLEEINEIIRIKKQELSELLRQQEQNIQDQFQNMNEQQRPLHLIVNGKPFSELREAEQWDSKKNSPRSFRKQRQQNIPSPMVQEQNSWGFIQETNLDQQQNNRNNELENQIDSIRNLQENDNIDNNINYQLTDNENVISFEERMKQECQDIFDILLATDSVYDLRIDDYQIGRPYSYKVNHSNLILLQEQEEKVFIHQVLWRRELQEVIPKLNSVNREMSVEIDSEDEYNLDSKQMNGEEEGVDHGHDVQEQEDSQM
ncbi:unnamed protein product (macronuclear) [Paramecium tetraurelia]|uniref:Uncharacterized protein n=1 Tax=Paramecium tetraurelia TaxID=5888 RepID=A0D2E2_PARTE|nr:uncharacterized protein GSPATT00012715001 [Paramecium tetraurelia]CAK77209.1 unnamed protein product [Paramecium tetraurelia]|eukprot:XP_001444606.1 hypothetical protein (macronuclear) [Paramecium tetraurelia strain d4-2]